MSWGRRKLKKKRIYKILFIVSFLPYIILLAISLYHAIFGYDVYTLILPTYVKTIYGIEAFVSTLFWNALALCFIPIIPICLLYQIIILVKYIIKKIKDRSFKNIVLYLIIACILLLSYILLFMRI